MGGGGEGRGGPPRAPGEWGEGEGVVAAMQKPLHWVAMAQAVTAGLGDGAYTKLCLSAATLQSPAVG